jgi:FlaA1/EpsC-like NDP-sugar epimerase
MPGNPNDGARKLCSQHSVHKFFSFVSRPEENMATTLQKFYEGKVVLLTGASGFLGKVLLLKLLLSCPDIKRIFVLLRRKNEYSCSERLSKILSNSVSVTCLCFIVLQYIYSLSCYFMGEVGRINV